jgi:Cu/Ag efflux protein CusF
MENPMKLRNLIAVAFVSLVLPLLPVTVLAAGEHDKHHTNEPAAGKAVRDPASMADGEVRKIDKDAKKITLKHGELKSLDMPAMTMVFQVKDGALLEKVKVGDKVKFMAERVSGGYAVAEIEVAK